MNTKNNIKIGDRFICKCSSECNQIAEVASFDDYTVYLVDVNIPYGHRIVSYGYLDQFIKISISDKEFIKQIQDL